jgi:hypothetical protein
MGALLVLALVVSLSAACSADVVVVANRAGRTVHFSMQNKKTGYRLQPGEVIPIFTDGVEHLQLVDGPMRDEYGLDVNCAYYFLVADGKLQLRQIDLGGDATTLARRDLPVEANAGRSTLRVSLLVDDDQPYTRRVWEPRLRSRMAAAAEILRKHSGISFEVAAVGSWESDDIVHDFRASLLEFISQVRPSRDIDLAIGFTSQYQLTKGQTHLGGTRFPLDRHILIREWSQHITEAEKLEVLVHELGHHLGASHSIEPDSVMRPVLGDRVARRRSFRILFDPVNTLAMSLIGEEIRRRDVRTLADLSTVTKLRLRQIYAELALAAPDDPVPQQYIMLLQ